MTFTSAGSHRKLFATALLVLLCSGCQSPPPMAVPRAPQQAQVPGDSLPDVRPAVPESPPLLALMRESPDNRQSPIDYLAGLTRLDADDARVEMEQLEASIFQLGESADCSVECTRLALLLSTGVADVPRHLERALDLLDRALASQSDGILQQSYLLFAKLWQQHLDALSRIDSLASRIDEQNGLIDALRMQIDELTALEQQLMNREEVLEP